MKTFPITQSEIDAYFAGLPEATRADVAKMALLKALVAAVVSQLTALEALVGYDVVLVPDAPAASDPAPASVIGAACRAPDEDLKRGDSRIGGDPVVGAICLDPDEAMGDWVNHHIYWDKHDGVVDLMADAIWTDSPSGKKYIVEFWRDGFSDAPKQWGHVMTTRNMNDVSRVYVRAHNAS